MESPLMSLVYEVWHFRIEKGEEFDWDEKKQVPQRFGVYSTETNALAAIERLRQWPDCTNWPDGFQVCPRFLDRDGWVDGFVIEYLPDED